jgi:peptidoglycan/xylan/chitin deacetylase (PgdA/CDA1 family)
MRPLNRRGLLGLALAGGVGILAGCTRAIRSQGSAAPTPGASTSPATVTPTATLTAPTVSASSMPATPTPSPSPSPASTGPAVEVGRGPSTRPEVALTFHGAGDPALARQLLALLASRQVTMTVMVVGTWLSDNPAMAAAILGGGHELGNHTFTHPTLSELSEAGVRSEIQRCRDLLVSLTGQPGTYFRQSAAQNSTPLIRSVAGSLGYRTCLSYDIDSLDWTDPSTATVRNAVKAATAGSIVSMHLGHPVTISALPGILDDLTARGLTPVTSSMLLRP